MGSRADLQEELAVAIDANVSIILVESFESERLEAIISQSAKDSGRRCFQWEGNPGIAGELKIWDIPEGKKKRKKMTEHDDLPDDLDGVHDYIRWFIGSDENELGEAPNDSILYLEDYHRHFNVEALAEGLDSPVQNYGLWGGLHLWREVAGLAARKKKSIILGGSGFEIPQDLQKEVLLLKLKLPDLDDLIRVAQRVEKLHGRKDRGKPNVRAVEASRGMTTMEAGTAFSMALSRSRGATLEADDAPEIVKFKKQLLQAAGGILEYHEPDETINDIGGLEKLIHWLREREQALSPEARDYGLEPPKGVLLLGVPGCGKSMTAKAIASLWNYPLVRFDLGKVFGSYVGQSEAQMRSALEVAEAVSPCILWIDEIEKGMAGVSSSGQNDSGVTARTFGTLLTWMQEKTSPVFVVATANRHQNLPAEALRKGRFDEMFFVDLPDSKTREIILEKQVSRLVKKVSKGLDYAAMASKTDLFSGAELEQAVKDAQFIAFSDGKRALKQDDLLSAVGSTFPLAITMEGDIAALRRFAKNRCRPASGDQIVVGSEDIKGVREKKYDDAENLYIDEEG